MYKLDRRRLFSVEPLCLLVKKLTWSKDAIGAIDRLTLLKRPVVGSGVLSKST